MDGNQYFLDGFLLKPAENSGMSGKIYIDDLRIIDKSIGTAPLNSAPIITALPDTSIEYGDNYYFFVEFSDDNESDIHRVIVNADTSAITSTIYGHTSESVVNIEYEPFFGQTNISVIVNDFGLGELSDTVQFLLTIQEALALDDENIPYKFSLGAPYPNPFNPIVSIPFTLEKQRNISIHIFDISGRIINTIVQDQIFNSGNYQKKWDGSNYKGKPVSTGTYIIQIISESEFQNQKITYIK